MGPTAPTSPLEVPSLSSLSRSGQGPLTLESVFRDKECGWPAAPLVLLRAMAPSKGSQVLGWGISSPMASTGQLHREETGRALPGQRVGEQPGGRSYASCVPGSRSSSAERWGPW